MNPELVGRVFPPTAPCLVGREKVREVARAVCADAAPIGAGDELTATLSVTGIRSLGGNAMITSEAEIVDASGAHVVTTTSVLLAGEAGA